MQKWKIPLFLHLVSIMPHSCVCFIIITIIHIGCLCTCSVESCAELSMWLMCDRPVRHKPKVKIVPFFSDIYDLNRIIRLLNCSLNHLKTEKRKIVGGNNSRFVCFSLLACITFYGSFRFHKRIKPQTLVKLKCMMLGKVFTWAIEA